MIPPTYTTKQLSLYQHWGSFFFSVIQIRGISRSSIPTSESPPNTLLLFTQTLCITLIKISVGQNVRGYISLIIRATPGLYQNQISTLDDFFFIIFVSDCHHKAIHLISDLTTMTTMKLNMSVFTNKSSGTTLLTGPSQPSTKCPPTHHSRLDDDIVMQMGMNKNPI